MAPDDTYRVGLTIGTDTFALTQDEADMLAYLLQRGKPRSAMDPADLNRVMDLLGWPKRVSVYDSQVLPYAPDRS